MAKKFLTNLDLAQNQLLNAAIQNLPSAPSSPVAGQIYFNTTDGLIYYYDGATWNDITGDVRDVLGGQGLTANTSNGVVTLDVNVDNSTIDFTGDSIQVKDSGITTSKIADLSTNLDYNSGLSAIPTAYAVKQYVDSVAGGIGNFEGGWDAVANGSYPAPLGVIRKGDYWYSTSAGTFIADSGTIAVEIGDVFVAKIDGSSPNLSFDWLVLQVNKDQANYSELGLVRLATDSDALDGIDYTKAITPSTLKYVLDNKVGGYSTTIGDGFSTSYNVYHGLNTMDVIVSLYDAYTGEEVIADVINNDFPTGTYIQVNFAVAPAVSSIRVVIKK